MKAQGPGWRRRGSCRRLGGPPSKASRRRRIDHFSDVHDREFAELVTRSSGWVATVPSTEKLLSLHQIFTMFGLSLVNLTVCCDLVLE